MTAATAAAPKKGQKKAPDAKPEKKELFENSTAAASSPIPAVDYITLPLKEIEINLSKPKPNAKRKVDSMVVSGQKVRCTNRFLTSFCANVGLSQNIFSLFDYAEVAERVMERQKADVVRLCLVRHKSGDIDAMAVSKPGKPILAADNLLFALGKFGVENAKIKYHDGIVTSVHTPNIGGDAPINIGGDAFFNRFVVDTPIDGYGNPASYVSLLRQRCSNGAIGYSKAFRADVNLGNSLDGDTVAQFQRFIDGFSNDEGYDAIRRRFIAAINSPASLNEFAAFHRILIGGSMLGLHGDTAQEGEMADGRKTFRSKITDTLWKLGGDPLKQYGLVSLDSMSVKKLRQLPCRCSVYDLINFATELATHHAKEAEARRLQGWVGTLISNEYDLEGVIEDKMGGKVGGDTPDLFFKDGIGPRSDEDNSDEE